MDRLLKDYPLRDPGLNFFVSGEYISFGYSESLVVTPARWLDRTNTRIGSIKEISIVRACWPVKALYRTTLKEHIVPFNSPWMAMLKNKRSTFVATQMTENYLLPDRLLWLGFFFNTLFYSGVIALLTLASRLINRRLRLRRSLCPACAYPMGASPVCTECGRALPAKALRMKQGAAGLRGR